MVDVRSRPFVGKLSPDVTLEQAQQEVSFIAAELPRVGEVGIDGTVAAITLGLALAMGLHGGMVQRFACRASVSATP